MEQRIKRTGVVSFYLNARQMEKAAYLAKRMNLTVGEYAKKRFMTDIGMNDTNGNGVRLETASNPQGTPS